MSIGSALAALLQADTDEQRAAASADLVHSQDAFAADMKQLGCQVTFGSRGLNTKEAAKLPTTNKVRRKAKS